MQKSYVMLVALAVAGGASAAKAGTIAAFHSGNGAYYTQDSQVSVNGELFTDGGVDTGNAYNDLAYIIEPNSNWLTIAGDPAAKWVSKYDRSGNIYPAQHPNNATTTDVYTLTFTSATAGLAELNLTYAGDNHTVDIAFNSGDLGAPTIFYNEMTTITRDVNVVAGLNTLTFSVADDGGPVGLIFSGSVASVPVPAAVYGALPLLGGLAAYRKFRSRRA